MKFKYCPPEIKFPVDVAPPENISVGSEYMELEELMSSILSMANEENSALYRLIVNFFVKGDEVLKVYNIDSKNYLERYSKANSALCDIIIKFIADEILSANYLYIDDMWDCEVGMTLPEFVNYVEESHKNDEVIDFVRLLAMKIGTIVFSTIDKLVSDVIYRESTKNNYNTIAKMLDE